MNLNASSETVQNVADAFKLAYFLDDKVGNPDKARIAAWAEQIERHRLAGSDLLDGVQAFYDQPRERAIGVGDLIHHAKIVKRDRLDREDEAAREVRRQSADLKVEEDVRSVMSAAVFGPVTPTERLKRAEAALQSCYGREESRAAILEFFNAKGEAAKASARKPWQPPVKGATA